jgi:hypothetical protein
MSRRLSAAKGIFLALGGLISAVALSAGGFIAYSARDKQDTFALADTEFADVGYLERLQSRERDAGSRVRSDFSVYAHRLRRGTGTIFAFREYSPGKLSVIDDERYRKITVWIAGDLPLSETEVPLGDPKGARVIISEGGSAWPRSGCSCVATAGIVRIQPNGKRFTVTIFADNASIGDPANSWCKPQKLDLSFVAKQIDFSDLTPWLGKQGRHPYEETYR